jgi:Spy/CpxP family protein refolding chaperone
MTRFRPILLAVCMLCVARTTPALAEFRGPGRMGPPPFLRELFPPQLIMRHQAEIGLTDAQRQAITKEMAAAQADLLDVRWKLEEKTAALTKLPSAEKIDEPAALAAADEVLKLEERLKRVRLGLMIRVKNVLEGGAPSGSPADTYTFPRRLQRLVGVRAVRPEIDGSARDRRAGALVPDERYVARPERRDGRPVAGSKHNRGAAVDVTLVGEVARASICC